MSTPDANGWMTIDSAPKDGTRILIVRMVDGAVDDEMEITEWCVREHFDWEQIEGDIWKKVPQPPYEFWNGNGHRATHWQPLPLPPVTNPGASSE
jgi:hypothetical protein